MSILHGAIKRGLLVCKIEKAFTLKTLIKFILLGKVVEDE